MNSEPDLPADDRNALVAGIKAHLRWVQQRLREGIDEHEHERLLGERRYGPLDLNDPRDRALASAWRAYEKVKQRCVETGCDPKHAQRIAWDFRPGSNQCAEIRCTTGRVKRIKVRWDKGRNNPPLHVPSRPRQPAARRRRPRKGLGAARGDPDPDPDPEKRSAAEAAKPRAAQAGRGDEPRDDDTPGHGSTTGRTFVARFAALRKSIALPLGGAICARD
jgi:hypothetical protein